MAKNKKQEQKQEQAQPTKSVNRKMTLSSAPNSLKKIRKVVDEFIKSGKPLTPSDKFDMRMASMYLDYLKESIDILMSGKRPVIEQEVENQPSILTDTEADVEDEDEDEEDE